MSSAGGARIVGLTRELLNKWNQSKDSWRDAKALEFEKKFLDELEASADHASTGIENLERIIRNIRSECE
jgi:hypothetical protein